MKDLIEHKGHTGSVRFSAEDEVPHGRIQGIRDLVTYEATDVAGLKRSFSDAVEDYLETCEQRGKAPEHPFKGSFNVRVGSQLHKRAAVFAAEHKKKLNSVVSEALEKYLETAEC